MNKVTQYILFGALFIFCIGYAFSGKFQNTPKTDAVQTTNCEVSIAEMRTIREGYDAYLKEKVPSVRQAQADALIQKMMAMLSTSPAVAK